MMASGEIRLSTMTMRRMPVLAQSGACGPCCGDGCGATGQSQGGSTTVTGSGFGGTFPDGTTIGGNSEIIATGNSGSSAASIGSTVSGWAGLGLSAVETINPAYARGYGFYWKPWANQYGAARSLGGLAHAGGWFTLGAATLFDLWDYSEGGPDAPNLTQVGTNAGVGTAGMLGGPLTVLPAAQYFLFQQLYNNFYPGGSTQAFSDLGGYLGNISATGLGP